MNLESHASNVFLITQLSQHLFTSYDLSLQRAASFSYLSRPLIKTVAGLTGNTWSDHHQPRASPVY